MAKFQGIQCIGFDADDTLWENGLFYGKAQTDFQDLMTESEICNIEDIFTTFSVFQFFKLIPRILRHSWNILFILVALLVS